MGRSPCCDKVGLKKGPWTPEEDQKLLAYIEEHGHGSWRALPTKAGLQRCGKSCRLRWTNYLRPDIKRGKFSLQEEQTIIQLHALLGNRWSAIATHLPKRTDNEIKNYWNTHLKKRLAKMGIDPVTHKPKNDALVSSSSDGGQSKNAANLSHMAQWESARLEAEARLVRESRLRAIPFQHPLGSPAFAPAPASGTPPPPPRSLDVLNAWQGIWSKSTTTESGSGGGGGGGGGGGVPTTGLGEDLESPTSTLTFSENNNNAALITSSGGGGGIGESSMAHMIDFVGNSSSCDQGGEMIKEEGEDQEWKGFGLNSIRMPEMSSFMSTGIHDMALQMDPGWSTATPPESLRSHHVNDDNNNGHEQQSFMGNGEGFTDLLLSSSTKRSNPSHGGCDDTDSDNGSGSGSDDCEENKNYWNTILNLVNSSPPDSPMF